MMDAYHQYIVLSKELISSYSFIPQGGGNIIMREGWGIIIGGGGRIFNESGREVNLLNTKGR